MGVGSVTPYCNTSTTPTGGFPLDTVPTPLPAEDLLAPLRRRRGGDRCSSGGIIRGVGRMDGSFLPGAGCSPPGKGIYPLASG